MFIEARKVWNNLTLINDNIDNISR
jgi:hypothetical protein